MPSITLSFPPRPKPEPDWREADKLPGEIRFEREAGILTVLTADGRAQRVALTIEQTLWLSNQCTKSANYRRRRDQM